MATFISKTNTLYKKEMPSFEIKIEPNNFDFPPKSISLSEDIQEDQYSVDEYSLSFSQWPVATFASNCESFESIDELWPIMSEDTIAGKCNYCTKQNCDSRRHSVNSVWIYPTCENCGIELNDLVELIINQSSRSTESCEFCLINYQPGDPDNIYHVLKHFERESTVSIEQYCADCDSARNMCESTDYLFVEKLEEVVLVDCKWCGNTLCSNALKQHQKRCYKRPERVKISEPRPQNFNCNHCPKKYSNYKNLSNHIISVHEISTSQIGFQCRFCDEKFTRSQRLMHEKEVHMDQTTGFYQCEYCERQCKSASEMEYHRFKHTTPFTCDICGHRCGMKRRLEEHMLTHSNIREHLCNQCSEAFKTPHLLKRHKERRHSDERPFQCDKCEKAYKDATDLRRHTRVHGGVKKNFRCEVCAKAFFEAKLLRYHMKTHSRDGRASKIHTVITLKNLHDMYDEENVVIMDH